MSDMPLYYQDAIHEAQFAVTQAEELLDLAQGRLAKAKEEYLRRFLQPPVVPSAAGFTRPTMVPAEAVAQQLGADMPTPRCVACSTSGEHETTDPQCMFHS